MIAGSAHARLGVYVAYFDAAEIYRLHLAAFRQTCSGAFNYYVMKNCTTAREAHRFDAIVSESGSRGSSRPGRPSSPSRTTSRSSDGGPTSDEIIVVATSTRSRSRPAGTTSSWRGWPTKDAVGVLRAHPRAHRAQDDPAPVLPRVPAIVPRGAQLDVLRRGDGDPGCRITEWLLENGRFHEGCVTPLLPTAHEMELFPGFTHPPVFGSRNLRHGLGTTYGDLVLHLWFWRIIARRRPVRRADGSVLVSVEQMEHVLESLRSKLGGTESAPSAPSPGRPPAPRSA